MTTNFKKQMRIGFISTWPIYQGTTIDWYARLLIQGINAAALENNCDLLLGCGFNVARNINKRRSFWPVSLPNTDFVPVGPWNTDGLIIVPDEISNSQEEYIQDLKNSGFPIVFTTPEGPGSTVSVDNSLAIKQAYQHLRNHGHYNIAFIAGHTGMIGDSEERLKAFINCVESDGISINQNLIEYGNHRKLDGSFAMQKIIDSGENFSAVIASNDLSALGAIETIRKNGLKIPEDVAIIGFDDILGATATNPTLTTVRHPTFSLGYHAFETLLDIIEKPINFDIHTVISPQLIVRRSCGCHPIPLLSSNSNNKISTQHVIEEIVKIVLTESRNSLQIDIETQTEELINAFHNSVDLGIEEIFINHISNLIKWTEDRNEEITIWEKGTELLSSYLNEIISDKTDNEKTFAINLINRARLEISDHLQRQKTRSLLSYMEMMEDLGQLTTEMLTVMNTSQAIKILSNHIEKLGINSVNVILYKEEGDDPKSVSEILFAAGLPKEVNGIVFETRTFPPQNVYISDKPLHLFILPLDIEEKNIGYVVFDAPNPEHCAAIVHNISSVIRTSRLYSQAVKGRQLAEEANQLKSRFLSMVSHELRTPLSLIVGLSDMVLKEMESNSNSNNESYIFHDIQQINNSSQHLTRLISDVLDLASSEAGQLRILHEPIYLQEVLQIISKLGKELASNKNLTWVEKFPDELPWVVGDRTRLRQILLNLISNAVKYTNSGTIQFEITQHANQVSLSVSDTGIGIKAEDITYIFDEFYRAKDIEQTEFNGLGLGLAITKQLVEHHNGTISVTSPGILGSGATFTVTLPIFLIKPSQIQNLPLFDQNKNKILLVSENQTPDNSLTNFLNSNNFEITNVNYSKSFNLHNFLITEKPTAIIINGQDNPSQGWNIKNILNNTPEFSNIPVYIYSINEQTQKGSFLELNFYQKPLQSSHLSQQFKEIQAKKEDQITVLIVDDDPRILEMNSRLVEKIGGKVIKAKNGIEALEIISYTEPDLILLDLMMPEKNGFEVLEDLQSNSVTRNIPVIILTAHVLSNAELERINLGVARILSKGLFDLEEILVHIEEVLNHKSSLGPNTQYLVRQAMAYIHNHYSDSINRSKIANQIGITEDYLTDCFRQELGITPIVYIRRFRINKACELLKTTNLSITQIAMNVGFSDGAHFTRTFLKEMEVTPRKYRQQN